MTQDRLKMVLQAGLHAQDVVAASQSDARFAQAAREVLLKHRAAKGFREPPPKDVLVKACCTKEVETQQAHTACKGGEAKCCHDGEGAEFGALEQRVQQLELLVRFLLSQAAPPYPVPTGSHITLSSERPESPACHGRSVSRH